MRPLSIYLVASFILSLTIAVPCPSQSAVSRCAQLFAGPAKGDIIILGLRKLNQPAIVSQRITTFVEDFKSAFPDPIQARLKTIVVRIKFSDMALDFANPLSNEVVLTLPRKLQHETDIKQFSMGLEDSLLALGHELGHLAFGQHLLQEFPELYSLAVLDLAKSVRQPKGSLDAKSLRNWRALTEKIKSDYIKFSSLSEESTRKLIENNQTLRSLMGSFHEFVADAAIGIHLGDLNALPSSIDRRFPSAQAKQRRFDIRVDNHMEWLFKIYLEALGNPMTLDYFLLQPAKFELHTLLTDLHKMSRETRSKAIAALFDAAVSAIRRANSLPKENPLHIAYQVLIEELRARQNIFR